jgi:dipicolinate synthase subunit A
LIISGGKTIRNSIDVAKRDDFSYKNAIPTAEGAIALAINNTDITLYDSKILITGFGKVAKILVQKLRGLCNDITVALRNKSDRELIETLGIKTIPIESIADYVTDYNIIFNTVPDEIFNKEILSTADSKNLFIELASNQLGFDTQAITKFKVNYINAPGLPNKVAPKTAAYIFADTITNILEEKNLL